MTDERNANSTTQTLAAVEHVKFVKHCNYFVLFYYIIVKIGNKLKYFVQIFVERNNNDGFICRFVILIYYILIKAE